RPPPGRASEAALPLPPTPHFSAAPLPPYPESLDAVRPPPRRNPSTAELTAQLAAEVDAAADDPAVLRVFRRFRARHTLRIGINDVLRDRPLEEVTRELARVADASIEVALRHALKTVSNRYGIPTAPGD